MKTPREEDHSVHVRNSISGNPPKTCTQTYVRHRGGQNVSIGYKSGRSDDSLSKATHGSNQTLRNTSYNVLPLGLQRRDLVGQGSIWMLWHRRDTCKIWYGSIMLKQSIVEVRVWNHVMLQDVVSISDARHCTCHMNKSRPTTRMDSCPHHDTDTTMTLPTP